MLKRNNPTREGINCQFSFADLFLAAEGRAPTKAESEMLSKLTRPQRNKKVKELAKKARWHTYDVRDKYDHHFYTAFWPMMHD